MITRNIGDIGDEDTIEFVVRIHLKDLSPDVRREVRRIAKGLTSLERARNIPHLTEILGSTGEGTIEYGNVRVLPYPTTPLD